MSMINLKQSAELAQDSADLESEATLRAASDLPFVILMGHLDGAPSRQAVEYVRSLAMRTVTEDGISYYGIQKTPTGVAFEIHEGGPGRALLPAVLAHVKEWGPYEQGESRFVDIPTNSRTLRVVRTASGGISSVQLSEGTAAELALPLQWGKALRPLADDGRALVAASKVVFAAGVIACLAMVGTVGFSTLQAVKAASRAVGAAPALAVKNLPSAGFAAMLAAGHLEGVNALRFRAGKWIVETDTGPQNLDVGAAPARPLAPHTSAGGPQ